MKTRFAVIITLAIIFMATLWKYGHAFQTTTWLSSNTAVNISTQPLCNTTGSGGSVRAVLHGVCINTAAAGNIQVQNNANPVATSSTTITGVYSTGTQVPCNFYDVTSSSNLFVTHNGTADVSILYQCF